MDMKTDVEELLRDGMGRFTEGVRAPGRAGQHGRPAAPQAADHPRRGGVRDGRSHGCGCGRGGDRGRRQRVAGTRDRDPDA